MCEEYDVPLAMIERGDPLWRGQSSSSLCSCQAVIKTNMSLNDDDLAQKEFLLQRYGERIGKLSEQARVEQTLYGCRIPDHS